MLLLLLQPLSLQLLQQQRQQFAIVVDSAIATAVVAIAVTIANHAKIAFAFCFDEYYCCYCILHTA